MIVARSRSGVQTVCCRGGTMLAHSGTVETAPLSRRDQRGFTLIELLVVAAIIGMLALVSTGPMMRFWRNQRLEGGAGQVAAYLRDAYVQSLRNSRTVTVTCAPDSNGIYTFTAEVPKEGGGTREVARPLTLAPGVAVLPTRPVAAERWPVAGGNYQIGCTVAGHAIDPATGAERTGISVMTITLDEMASGAVTPRIDYRLEVLPLWSVSMRRVKIDG